MGMPHVSKPDKRRHASFTILQLPAEIRQHIYHAALALPAIDHLSLLCASRQIYREVRESYYKRPLRLSSQSALVDFAAPRLSTDLKLVSNIQLTLEDLDSTSMQVYLARLVLGLPLDARDHPYLREGQRIVSCLERLPHVKHLSLLSPPKQAGNPPSELVSSNVMCWAQRQHKQLESLQLSIETISLEQLRGLSKLRSLSFTGYSLCTPTETLDLLSQLGHLYHLYITGLSHRHRWSQQRGRDEKVKQSFTATVLGHMNPLTTLRICDMASNISSADNIFLTTSMLRAICQTHLESLRDLQLSSRTTPSPAVLEHISAIIRLLPDLRTLTLEWPEFDIHHLTFVPPSIQHLTISVQSNAHAQAAIKTLHACVPRLPHLKRIQFNTIPPLSKTQAQPMQKMRPCALDTSWTITWGVMSDE